jgi:hypothetical protein
LYARIRIMLTTKSHSRKIDWMNWKGNGEPTWVLENPTHRPVRLTAIVGLLGHFCSFDS